MRALFCGCCFCNCQTFAVPSVSEGQRRPRSFFLCSPWREGKNRIKRPSAEGHRGFWVMRWSLDSQSIPACRSVRRRQACTTGRRKVSEVALNFSALAFVTWSEVYNYPSSKRREPGTARGATSGLCGAHAVCCSSQAAFLFIRLFFTKCGVRLRSAYESRFPGARRERAVANSRARRSRCRVSAGYCRLPRIGRLALIIGAGTDTSFLFRCRSLLP